MTAAHEQTLITFPEMLVHETVYDPVDAVVKKQKQDEELKQIRRHVDDSAGDASDSHWHVEDDENDEHRDEWADDSNIRGRNGQTRASPDWVSVPLPLPDRVLVLFPEADDGQADASDQQWGQYEIHCRLDGGHTRKIREVLQTKANSSAVGKCGSTKMEEREDGEDDAKEPEYGAWGQSSGFVKDFNEDFVVTHAQVPVDGDEDQRVHWHREADAHDEGRDFAVKPVDHRGVPDTQVQQPHKLREGDKQDVGDGKVGDVDVVDGPQSRLV